MASLQDDKSLSKTAMNFVQSNFSSFIRKSTQRPAPISPCASSLSKSRPHSAKNSPLNMSEVHKKHSLGMLPISMTNRKQREKATNRSSSFNEQDSSIQEGRRSSTGNQVQRYKQLSLSQSLQPENFGLIDRYTFYSSDYSLFESCPRKSAVTTPTKVSNTSQFTPQKSSIDFYSSIIKEELNEGELRSERSSHRSSLAGNSTQHLKSKGNVSAKQLENLVQGSLASRLNRPATTKNINNRSLSRLSDSNDGAGSVKNISTTFSRMSSPHAQSSAFLKKSTPQTFSSSIQQPRKKMQQKTKLDSGAIKEISDFVLADKDLNLVKSLSPPKNKEFTSPYRNTVKKNPLLEPSSSDYGKYNKIFKGIGNKGSSRFDPEKYKRLGKNCVDDDDIKNRDQLPSQRDLYKAQRKSKGLHLSQGNIPAIIEDKVPQLGCSSIGNIDNTLNPCSTERIVNEDDQFTYNSQSARRSGSIASLSQLDQVQSYTSLDKGIESCKNIKNEPKKLVRMASGKTPTKNTTVKPKTKPEKDIKSTDREVVKKQQGTFEEFFSNSIRYMCEIIDGNENNSEKEDQEAHLNTLLDQIIKEIYALKKGTQETSDRSIIAKRLVMLLNMALRSMVCVVRRKENSIRKFYNKNSNLNVKEKNNSQPKEEDLINFEELCGLEDEEEECEENEISMREKLCQEIQKRKEELEELEKVLKDAKKNKTLQHILVVNIKVNNLLKSKKKSLAQR